MKQIDTIYQCVPFWSWNDELDEKELIKQIEWMHSQVKTTSELVVCTYPKRVGCRRTRQRASKFDNASLTRAAAMLRLSFL